MNPSAENIPPEQVENRSPEHGSDQDLSPPSDGVAMRSARKIVGRQVEKPAIEYESRTTTIGNQTQTMNPAPITVRKGGTVVFQLRGQTKKLKRD